MSSTCNSLGPGISRALVKGLCSAGLSGNRLQSSMVLLLSCRVFVITYFILLLFVGVENNDLKG